MQGTNKRRINRVVDRMPRRSDQVLVVTAAYTGMRWSGFAGLAKNNNTHLGDGLIRVHPTQAPCTKSAASCTSDQPNLPPPPATSTSPRF